MIKFVIGFYLISLIPKIIKRIEDEAKADRVTQDQIEK
jgi:hypothetical protein